MAVGVVAAGFIVVAQGRSEHDAPHSPPPAVPVRALRSIPVPAAPPSPLPLDELQPSFEQLAATLPADVGVAVSAGDVTMTYGNWQTGAAWSTIKVPLAIAAIRKDPAAAEPLVDAAITQSDNAAADQLWDSLGTPTDAGAAVQQVLADGNNAGVGVQTTQVRPPYSPYGQTTWSLEQAARFAFTLPCLAVDSLLGQMADIATDQQWGFAGDTGVAAKGGWGPEADGGYLVRQIALVGDGPDSFGVAVAAKPNDGTFATGTAMLDQLANWVGDHRTQLPKGNCAG
ncbi:hypothetical protein H5P33_21510 [Mycolicibacterium arabiense]|nr:serine hydrolase [Mycolicibacterium arabiense]MCV7375301.1 hypothetical protein [Mycolicibacterium arabiense]